MKYIKEINVYYPETIWWLYEKHDLRQQDYIRLKLIAKGRDALGTIGSIHARIINPVNYPSRIWRPPTEKELFLALI